MDGPLVQGNKAGKIMYESANTEATTIYLYKKIISRDSIVLKRLPIHPSQLFQDDTIGFKISTLSK